MLGQKLFSENRIAFEIEKLGRRIVQDYLYDSVSEVTLLVFLKGAGMFASDLSKRLTSSYIDYQIEYVFNSDNLEQQLISLQLQGKNVLLIEDIIDSGKTIIESKKVLQTQGLKSLKIVSLLVRGRDSAELADYYGFLLTTPEFIIGYGLDYKGLCRNLPDVYVYEKS